uniref:NADH-ubiquinone oxidoreductase chain 5 n=1 Tax=Polydora hoplura TaxID=1495204 RepID=A0A8F9S294_9ANNE|nr:NADH dehydrogenase subunit 5 [Polydora hoplura]QYL01501.1 NADH dehydrogenase subunit 5 [Polydora hoplura]
MWHPVKAGSSLIFSLIGVFPLLLFIYLQNKTIVLTWDFFLSPSMPMSLSILLDQTGLTLMATVLFIAANVLFFTAVYMEDDPFIPRFTALVMSFIFSMCILVILPNLITLLLGWDGLGLSSYLLVLYYQTPKSQGAALITAMTNRLGDLLILFTVAWCLNTHWLPLLPWSSPSHFLIASMLIIAAMTKSAQFPFISWLPAAMAAPTPVSALVHSSTLVTAGIFILIRFFPSLKSITTLEYILLFMAAITACVAGLAAMAECDMKKVIALSTLSQLGTMAYSLAMNMPHLAFFHLITHALFKALLFMAAGTLIHYHDHNQDLRAMGMLNNTMPMISTMIVGSSLALCGAPFMAGFYSKDLIIEAQISNPFNYFLIMVFLLATGLTSAYSMRFMLNVVWSPRQAPPTSMFQPSPNLLTMGPTLALATMTVIGGASLFWVLILPESEAILPLSLKLHALFAMIIGTSMGWILNYKLFNHSSWLMSKPLVNEFLTSLAFTTPINAQATSRIPLFSGANLQKNMDGGWVEIFGGQGSLSSFSSLSPKISSSSGKSLAANLLMFLLFSVSIFLL